MISFVLGEQISLSNHGALAIEAKAYLVKRTVEVNFIVQASNEVEASKKVTKKDSTQVRVVQRPHLDKVIDVSDVVDCMVSDNVIQHIPPSVPR